MKLDFYDIECLDNVFTLANWQAQDKVLDMYYLIDMPSLIPNALQSLPPQDQFYRDAAARIRETNRNFDGTVRFFDLSQPWACAHMAQTFGLSDSAMVNDPAQPSHYPAEFRPICDTDPDYNIDIHPFFLGYNSDNYDTTVATMFLHEVFFIKGDTVEFRPTTAALMRQYNNELFSEMFKQNMPNRLRYVWNHAKGRWEETGWNDVRCRIRRNMILSGRQIDLSAVNEKQSHVGLKRLLGMSGGQILESKKLRPGQSVIETYDQLLDLFGYNASDVINLDKRLWPWDNKFYETKISQKLVLFKTYPELIYQKQKDVYAPEISQKTVRRDRLTPSSTSAQQVTKSLCPYGHLTDIQTVSFMYPNEQISQEQGIPRKNILEELKKFYYALFPQPEIRADFDRIYDFYKSLEGKNFNNSQNYIEDWQENDPNDPNLVPHSTAELPEFNGNILYRLADGSPTSCYANFSIGGIHGAEYNKPLFDMDMDVWRESVYFMEQCQRQFPDPRDLKKARAIEVQRLDGSTVKLNASYFLVNGSTLKEASYKDFSEKKPVLFPRKVSVTGKISYPLNNKYKFTSSGPTNHEDFESYYPNLLRMLRAFWNSGLGYDRYAEVFKDKKKFGKLMKDLSLPETERAQYKTKRENTKLLLNSASGKADDRSESNIRMNNNIISMRCIGQMFSFWIGCAQAYQGAKVISTNTDGLYTIMEEQLNNQILADTSKEIGVNIEPEPVFLISKDANNRIELSIKEDSLKIITANGGDLACRNGPNPQKSLDHPAICDWALSEYLIVAALHHKGLTLYDDADRDTVRNILNSAKDKFSPEKWLNMFQLITKSAEGTSPNIVFAIPFGAPLTTDTEPIILQRYNRIFLMKQDTPNALNLASAVSKIITPAMAKKRRDNNEKDQQHNPLALKVLAVNGFDNIPYGREAQLQKIKDIEGDWAVAIENHDLAYLTPEEQSYLIDNLDIEKYVSIVCDKFNDNWKNIAPVRPELKTAAAVKKGGKKKAPETTPAPVTLPDPPTPEIYQNVPPEIVPAP